MNSPQASSRQVRGGDNYEMAFNIFAHKFQLREFFYSAIQPQKGIYPAEGSITD
jgi:hypothetical protein